MVQLGGFLGRLLGPLFETGLPLMKNVIKLLAKSVLLSLGLTAAASASSSKGVSETIQYEAKEQKGGFISILLGNLGASLLGNISTGKGAIAKRQGQGIVRAGYGNKKVKEL